MGERIVEIASDNQNLSVYRGFLRITNENGISDVPLNGIGAIITTANQITYTHQLLKRLCEEQIPLIITGKNYEPSGIILPLIGQLRQSEIQQIQINQTKPIYKKIWQVIIQEKIKNQSRVLDLFHKKNILKDVYKYVLSGDTNNKEGYVAKIYFKSLFGSNFTRNRDLSGINSFLNYGYAILRSALARYVVASGLNPSYGINHKNKLNPLCLVDDLIEPFRPLVDVCVYRIFAQDAMAVLEPKYKAQLANLLTTEFKTIEGKSPLNVILQQSVWDLVNIYKTKTVYFHFSPYLFQD